MAQLDSQSHPPAKRVGCLRWLFPLGMLAFGAIVFLGGIIWAGIAVGFLPTPDATPAQYAYETFHLKVSSTAMIAGLTLMLLAILSLLFVLAHFLYRRFTAP
jgi:hypothetical protein